jgi:hypothetical protein
VFFICFLFAVVLVKNSARRADVLTTAVHHFWKNLGKCLAKLQHFNLGLVHPVALVFNENHKSITFVRNLSRLYYAQYNTTLHVSAIQPSSGVSYIQKC